MGGFVVQNDVDDTKYQRVKPKKLWEMFTTGALPWPECTDDDIEDRSKADWLVKAIGLIQILWFVAQTISRWAQDLVVTTLEIFTLGIVICAAFVYLASWEQPFDVQVPIAIHTKISLPQTDCVHRVGLTDEDVKDTAWPYFGASAVSILFGAIHIVAWNAHFPSFAEQVLWKASSVGCTTLPLLLFFLPLDIMPNLWAKMVGFTALTLYIVFRIYMFVEMFVSLRAVPASVYQTPQWSQYFPALG
jgi:hypothetical protein